MGGYEKKKKKEQPSTRNELARSLLDLDLVCVLERATTLARLVALEELVEGGLLKAADKGTEHVSARRDGEDGGELRSWGGGKLETGRIFWGDLPYPKHQTIREALAA